jgi:hypothetical protein
VNGEKKKVFHANFPVTKKAKNIFVFVDLSRKRDKWIRKVDNGKPEIGFIFLKQIEQKTQMI